MEGKGTHYPPSFFLLTFTYHKTCFTLDFNSIKLRKAEVAITIFFENQSEPKSLILSSLLSLPYILGDFIPYKYLDSLTLRVYEFAR